MIGLMAETIPERSHELWHQFKNAVKSMPSYIPIRILPMSKGRSGKLWNKEGGCGQKSTGRE